MVKSNYKDDEVVIKSTKVYTSYFARASKILPNRRMLSIARSSPDGWQSGFMRELNPSQDLLFNYKYNNLSSDEYRKIYYFETLSKLDPQDIYNRAKGKVLCCWEKSGDFCHRHIVLEWLRDNLGDQVIGGEI